MTREMEELIERLDALSEKATKGPWRTADGMEFVLERPDGWTVGDFERGDEDSPISEAEADANAAFVAALRNAWPTLRDALRAHSQGEQRHDYKNPQYSARGWYFWEAGCHRCGLQFRHQWDLFDDPPPAQVPTGQKG